MYNFFAMLSRMKYINRWGLMRNIKSENICEHSLDTAMIAHALVVIGNKRFGGDRDPGRAALLAMYHDASEIITGDLPTPIKYHSDRIRDAYRDVEGLAVDTLVEMLPEDLKGEYADILNFAGEGDEDYHRYVKAADKISAVAKCIEEKKFGNTEFIAAEKTLRQAVKDMDMPEADTFMEEFLPAYELALDELTELTEYRGKDEDWKY